MKNIKFLIPVLIICLTIGYAAQNITLSITGDTYIASDLDDFDVYISDISLNYEQNIYILTSPTSFTASYPSLSGEDYFEVEVTNSSEHFDAMIDINCNNSIALFSYYPENGGDLPLTLSSRDSIKVGIDVIYIGQYEGLQGLSYTCNVEATPIERNALGEGEVPEAVDPWKIGNEITIDTETFNIIWTTEDTVTLLAKYNLGTDYRQNETENSVTFSNSNGWPNTPGPKDINIQNYAGNAKTYVNEYVNYLKEQTGDTSLTGNLLTLTELGTLGCTITPDYSWQDDLGCSSSIHNEWLTNNQNWWIRSAGIDWNREVWAVEGRDGYGLPYYYVDHAGIRPIITLSKSALTKTIIEFTIDDTTYKAYKGMTLGEWVNSAFNPNVFALGSCGGDCSEPCTLNPDGGAIVYIDNPMLILQNGNNPSVYDEISEYGYDLAHWGTEGACLSPL